MFISSMPFADRGGGEKPENQTNRKRLKDNLRSVGSPHPFCRMGLRGFSGLVGFFGLYGFRFPTPPLGYR
jgi:hypothetical protein